MNRVELLPSGSTHQTPGWTYVPADTNRSFDPAKAAITPSIGRKRGIRDPARTDLSSRQQNAIVRHLADLDRENHRDVAVPIPTRQHQHQQKDGAGRTRGKVTPNVRRILQSQKTFRNYLDDEEAAQAQLQGQGQGQGQQQQPTAPQASAQAAALKPSHAGKIRKVSPSGSRGTSTTPSAASARQNKNKKRQTSAALSSSRATSATSTPAAGREEEKSGGKGEGKDEHQPDREAEIDAAATNNKLIVSEHDNDPLLRSYIPRAPSERIMAALLAEPPLSYHAARAGPPVTGKAPRHFCCMCGYWGKIRCRGCGQRTCGLECYKTHEESRCGAFF